MEQSETQLLTFNTELSDKEMVVLDSMCGGNGKSIIAYLKILTNHRKACLSLENRLKQVEEDKKLGVGKLPVSAIINRTLEVLKENEVVLGTAVVGQIVGIENEYR